MNDPPNLVTGKAYESSIRCNVCNVHTVVKSNKAVWEEFDRHLKALSRPRGHHCPDDSCENHNKLFDSHPKSYFRHGTSAAGAPRYRCRACRKTFSVRTAHSRHRKSHENKTVFQLFVSKVPIAGLERAPQYPRRVSRKWYLYGFYSPEMVEKALVIYRTYFNFIAKGADGKTPAMRIGLRPVFQLELRNVTGNAAISVRLTDYSTGRNNHSSYDGVRVRRWPLISPVSQ